MDRVDLAEYKGVQPPFDQWSHVAGVCGTLSDWLLNACLQALAGDTSAAGRHTQTRIDAWLVARTVGQGTDLGKLPGLDT